MSDPLPLTWTTNKPTQPGWYWWRNKPGAEKIERVQLFDFVWLKEPYLGVETQYARYPVSTIIGEWAGPLEPPKEA